MPIPTLPPALISMLLVGAPGRILKGNREPLVISRTNQLASFAPMSQVCAVNPPPLLCSIRNAGVSVAVTWTCNIGEALPMPTFPDEATNSELVGAPAIIVKGVFPPVISSIENLLVPPLLESLAVNCRTASANQKRLRPSLPFWPQTRRPLFRALR